MRPPLSREQTSRAMPVRWWWRCRRGVGRGRAGRRRTGALPRTGSPPFRRLHKRQARLLLVVAGQAREHFPRADHLRYPVTVPVMPLDEPRHGSFVVPPQIRIGEPARTPGPLVHVHAAFGRLERRRDLADELVEPAVVQFRNAAVDVERPHRTPALPPSGRPPEMPEHRDVLRVQPEQVRPQALASDVSQKEHRPTWIFCPA
jgi:hypothetical protein